MNRRGTIGRTRATRSVQAPTEQREAPHDLYVRETLKRAEAGSCDEAREALRLFVVSVLGGRIKCFTRDDARLLDYVALRLDRFLREGGDLERTLGVKRPKKRPPDEKFVEHSVARAAAVELLMRHRWKKTAAVEAVCAATGADRRTVMRDCKGWLRGSLPDKYLRHLAIPVTRSPNFPPLPAE